MPNPRRRVLDAIRDAEVRGNVPWGQRLPRQRKFLRGRFGGPSVPIEPPHTDRRYWGPGRFFRR
jgi:hypothetical protein